MINVISQFGRIVIEIRAEPVSRSQSSHPAPFNAPPSHNHNPTTIHDAHHPLRFWGALLRVVHSAGQVVKRWR